MRPAQVAPLAPFSPELLGRRHRLGEAQYAVRTWRAPLVTIGYRPAPTTADPSAAREYRGPLFSAREPLVF